jgi:hypothetical protein
MRPHRQKNGTILFSDHPEFRPNLTPREIFAQGAFGGTYWRPIHSAVTGRDYKGLHGRYRFGRIPERLLCAEEYDASVNKYGVKSGTSLEYWESHGWITAQDPYGWVQWYCEFYYGRRSLDDPRQIRRWLAFAGDHGRFYARLVGLIRRSRAAGNRGAYRDPTISPIIRQGLHHWAREITREDIK